MCAGLRCRNRPQGRVYGDARAEFERPAGLRRDSAGSGQREAALEATAERQAFLAQFEAPTREPLEYQGGIPQILTLLNGRSLSG